ncbi:DUF6702 family protein [Algoriphagus limi]|uniref:Uncharacterized protein n=1 Tax=Algoriphagus limi TaxID=2975273 RepID=A0ABT2G7B3_9BACT|nr:DUF6702 family protein [Algoriphagus limi]MCS5491154.1 hypothetical protein [Algoriphagus limi]
MLQIYTSILTLGWMVLSHPFFISLTEIRQNSNSKRLEIATKIFWDDLEVGLGNFHDEKIDFLNPENPEKLEEQIAAYFHQKIQFWVDGKEVNWSLLGFEIEEDAAWFYLESEPVEFSGKFKVKNSVLMEDFSTQQNIIHIYEGNSRSPKSMLLTKGNEWDEMSLK